MASTDKGVWVEGEKALYLNMQRVMGSNLQAARSGLRKAGMSIIKDAVQNLKKDNIWASGKLAGSGKVQKVEGDEDAIDVGFFAKDDKGGYAAYVEYGRKATKNFSKGSPTLREAIEAWLMKKTSVRKGIKSAFESAAVWAKMSPEQYRRSLAFLIARSIHKNGTKPHPFFKPAVSKNEKAIEAAIQEAVKEDL